MLSGQKDIVMFMTGMPSLSDIVKCVDKLLQEFSYGSKIIFNYSFLFPFSWYHFFFFFPFRLLVFKLFFQYCLSNVCSPAVIVSSILSALAH